LMGSVADVIHRGVGATSFAVYLRRAEGYVACIAMEDGSPVAGAAFPDLEHDQIHGILSGDECVIGGHVWGVIRSSSADNALGMVVCTRLLPSQDPAIAAHRLHDICNILAALLPVCPEPHSEARHLDSV